MKTVSFPTIDEAKKLAKGHAFVPVAIEVYADTETPVSLFQRIEAQSKSCFLLDSVEGGEKWARFSFIGNSPLLTIKSHNGKTVITGRDGKIEQFDSDPVKAVREVMEKYSAAHVEGIPRFSGGAVGFLGYDVVRYYENLPNVPKDDLNLPDAHFMLVDELIAFDNLRQMLTIIVNMPTDGDIEKNYVDARARLEKMFWVIRTPLSIADTMSKSYEVGEPECNLTKEEYCKMVEKAKEYIKKGDIFQVVLSRRIKIPAPENQFDIYRVLRLTNPSPYMFYFKFDGYSMAGASPEMLVRCEDGKVETCPIAGTRPRGKTPEEDEQLEKELMQDKKELSEHSMLVDLARNDVGKISEFGSVKLTEYMKVAKFSKVMHITSLVQGKLRKELSPFDAVSALLPAGTLSGAPKVRAMEIIDELETVKRGPYGGSVAYLSFDGNIDSCITIRTIIFKDGYAYVQAGAGIVADSVPETEYEETVNKAQALVNVLKRQVL